MQNKKIGAYSLVAVLLVAGSNLHGSDGNWGRTVVKKGREALLYGKENPFKVGLNATTLFNFATTLLGVIQGRATNQEIVILKQKVDAFGEQVKTLKGFEDANKFEGRFKGVEGKIGVVEREIADIKSKTIRGLQDKCEGYDKQFTTLNKTTIPGLKKQITEFNKALAKKADKDAFTKLEIAFGGFKQKRQNLNLEKRLKALEDQKFGEKIAALTTKAEFNRFVEKQSALKLVTEERLKTFGFVTQATLKALVARVSVLEARKQPEEAKGKHGRTLTAISDESDHSDGE